jgi:hypothetical protein
MSSGYTSVKANMAPADPATACPTGGKFSLVMAAITINNEKEIKKRDVNREKRI